MKLFSVLFRLSLAAAALAACVYAVARYWDELLRYLHAGRRLYCRARNRNDFTFHQGEGAEDSDYIGV